MKKNEHTDWTDALRDALHDAEITPSEGGWERLLRDLEGGAAPRTETAASERLEIPDSGSLRPERGSLPAPESVPQPAADGGKPRWRIFGLRIAAAAAVVVIAIVGGELLWHPDRTAGTMPELTSVTPREDTESGSQLRDEVAEASGWSQSPKSDAESSRGAGTVAESSRPALLAAADAEREASRGESASARKRETTRLAAEPASEPAASEQLHGESRTEGDPVASEARKEAGTAVELRDETESTQGAASRSDSERESGNAVAQGETTAATRSAEHAERSGASESRSVQQASERRRAASKSVQRSSDDLYAWADPASEDEEAGAPRRRRASFSLFAAGGTASGSNLQTADFLSSPPTGNVSPSIVGNGDRFGPLVRDDYNESSFRHHLPLSFGLSVTAEFPYGLSIESGVNYTLLRSDVRRSYSSREISQKLHFIGVPLRLNWQFVERGRLAVYLAGGGMVEKCVSARLGGQSVDESNLQWSLMGALGAQYRLGDMVGLYFEPELSYYLTDTELRTSRSDAPLTLTLRIGVRLLF